MNLIPTREASRMAVSSPHWPTTPWVFPCGLHLESVEGLVTVGLAVDFLSSARIGEWLEIQPDVVKVGGTLAFAQCLVMANGKPCARANATFSILKKLEKTG